MKEVIYTLKLDRYDYGIIFHILNDRRNQLIKSNSDTEAIDNVLLKVIEAKERYKGRDSYGR